MKLNHLVSLLSRLQLHAESTRIQGYIIYICAFLFGYSGQSCFKTSVSLSHSRGGIVKHTSTPALTCVYTPISALGRGETHTEWLLNGREELRGKRDGENKRTREESETKKWRGKLACYPPKKLHLQRGVSRLRNRRETLLLWWFKGGMTSLSSLKSQLVSDSVSQLWREFLLSGTWRCSVDCSQEDLQQKRGSRAGAGTKVSSSLL